FGLWRSVGLPSPATKLSRRASVSRSLRGQPELSLWPSRAYGKPAPLMAEPVAVCGQHFKLNCQRRKKSPCHAELLELKAFTSPSQTCNGIPDMPVRPLDGRIIIRRSDLAPHRCTRVCRFDQRREPAVDCF